MWLLLRSVTTETRRSPRRHLARCAHRQSRTQTAYGLSRSGTAEGIIVGWVNDARKRLSEGRAVQVRPVGGSMRGRIESGQLVTLAPVDPADVRPDDVVLVAWKGGFLLHLVKEVKDGQLLIGNNLGRVNGWVEFEAVLGRVTGVGE